MPLAGPAHGLRGCFLCSTGNRDAFTRGALAAQSLSRQQDQPVAKHLDLNRGAGARNGDYVNEWDCLGQSTQRWGAFPWPGDLGALGIYNLRTRDCLDVFRNGTGNGVWADIWPCKQSDNENQKWTRQYLGYSFQSG